MDKKKKDNKDWITKLLAREKTIVSSTVPFDELLRKTFVNAKADVS